ncbi:MAG: 4-hydroxythreonine-4-phosphate dehydrogenase [Verrucomicrobiota bacterium]|jgi:4-hydroxythreonine-4-phosphate dehydrogenase
MRHPPIAITAGDPAGIGPEITAAWLASNPALASETVAIGCAAWTSTLRSPSLAVGDRNHRPNPGRPEPEGQRIALAAMEEAAEGVKEGRYRAVVTGPVSKEGLAGIGFKHPGQTEFFAAKWGGTPVMAFAGGRMTVGLATWHIPLSAVPSALTKESVRRTALALHRLKIRLGVTNPKIAVCGLNPHAGEKGLMGEEDMAVIRPAVESLRAEGIDAEGPLPGDTVFHRHLMGDYDAVVAAYHDQGLGPLKSVDFASSANLSLGLPYVRTSPDHGTAYALVGTGRADIGSFDSAVRLALRLTS